MENGNDVVRFVSQGGTGGFRPEAGTAGTGAGPLSSMDLEHHLADPLLKPAYVRPMFDLIAPRYDEFTRRFSFGMDRRWKAHLVSEAARCIPHAGQVADLASGTGDLALALAQARPDLRITTVDISAPMVRMARTRRASLRVRNVEPTLGNLAALGLATGSCQGAMAGYGLRNAPDWRLALGEIARIVGSGGHLFTLDFYRPASALWRRLFLQWLWITGRLTGRLWHNEPMAYGYIARSIDHFVSWQEFGRALGDAGFRLTSARSHLGGGIAIHHAIRV